jgi:hypothetical protein
VVIPNKYLLLTSAAIYLSLQARAQDTIPDKDIEQKIESIAESAENEDLDYSTLLDGLNSYRRHPLNLNTASREELDDLALLNDIQINNLLQHIEQHCILISLQELQSIDGFDLETIRKILPYVRIGDEYDSPYFSAREMLKYGKQEITLRYQQVLEKQAGFLPLNDSLLMSSPNAYYLGSPQRLYARYRFTYGTNVSWGLTAEKDAGEEFFTGSQPYGFDFYSAHFFIRNTRFIKALAIGDYQVNFGQGLTAWSGLAFGKSPDAINTRKNAQGIRPYTSVDENLFMRGAALTTRVKRFEVTGFFSHKNIDANITQDTLTDETFTVSSIQETGYHTTVNEMADRHALEQTVLGGNINYKKRNLSIGITGIHTEYGAPLQRKLSLYNQFEFAAKSNTAFGADYSFLYRNFNFFGEASVSDNGGYAYLNGLLISLDPRLSLAVLHRNYERNFQSLLSNAFGESTRASNERGIYTGIIANPVKNITLTAYYDRFVFPWLKYQVNAPSYGNDLLAQVSYTPNKKFSMYFRIRQRDKFKNTSQDISEIDFIVPVKQTNYRFDISYPATNTVKLRNRVELVTYDIESRLEKGYLLYQDVIYKPVDKRVSFSFRYALFQSDSYDSRMYAFESDVPGSWSIPAYYYRGSRTYIMVNYDISRHFELWLRWSQTYYSNKNIISEGSLNEIQGNTKSEMKVQLRMKL